jgi:hypothetical protein
MRHVEQLSRCQLVELVQKIRDRLFLKDQTLAGSRRTCEVWTADKDQSEAREDIVSLLASAGLAPGEKPVLVTEFQPSPRDKAAMEAVETRLRQHFDDSDVTITQQGIDDTSPDDDCGGYWVEAEIWIAKEDVALPSDLTPGKFSIVALERFRVRTHYEVEADNLQAAIAKIRAGEVAYDKHEIEEGSEQWEGVVDYEKVEPNPAETSP